MGVLFPFCKHLRRAEIISNGSISAEIDFPLWQVYFEASKAKKGFDVISMLNKAYALSFNC
jgi:hypothetical protein